MGFTHLLIIVNGYPVQLDCHTWPRCALAVLIELGVSILDVIGLPRQRRQAHVKLGSGYRIDSTTLIHQSLEPKGIEHLSLPAPLVIDSAVSPPL